MYLSRGRYRSSGRSRRVRTWNIPQQRPPGVPPGLSTVSRKRRRRSAPVAPSRKEFGAATHFDVKHRGYRLATQEELESIYPMTLGPIGWKRHQTLFVRTKITRRVRRRSGRLKTREGNRDTSAVALGPQVPPRNGAGLPDLPSPGDDLVLWNRSRQTMSTGKVVASFPRTQRATTGRLVVARWKEGIQVDDPLEFADW